MAEYSRLAGSVWERAHGAVWVNRVSGYQVTQPPAPRYNVRRPSIRGGGVITDEDGDPLWFDTLEEAKAFADGFAFAGAELAVGISEQVSRYSRHVFANPHDERRRAEEQTRQRRNELLATLGDAIEGHPDEFVQSLGEGRFRAGKIVVLTGRYILLSEEAMDRADFILLAEMSEQGQCQLWEVTPEDVRGCGHLLPEQVNTPTRYRCRVDRLTDVGRAWPAIELGRPQV